uniref:transposase n=1 Tax=Bacillus thuringiensis TaxID=1428 RepID=UPI0011A7E07C
MGEYLVEVERGMRRIGGIGVILGGRIVSEIGNIDRFDKAAKVVGYGGIDACI